MARHQIGMGKKVEKKQWKETSPVKKQSTVKYQPKMGLKTRPAKKG